MTPRAPAGGMDGGAAGHFDPQCQALKGIPAVGDDAKSTGAVHETPASKPGPGPVIRGGSRSQQPAERQLDQLPGTVFLHIDFGDHEGTGHLVPAHHRQQPDPA